MMAVNLFLWKSQHICTVGVSKKDWLSNIIVWDYFRKKQPPIFRNKKNVLCVKIYSEDYHSCFFFSILLIFIKILTIGSIPSSVRWFLMMHMCTCHKATGSGRRTQQKLIALIMHSWKSYGQISLCVWYTSAFLSGWLCISSCRHNSLWRKKVKKFLWTSVYLCAILMVVYVMVGLGYNKNAINYTYPEIIFLNDY